jgi:hypothetical protein
MAFAPGSADMHNSRVRYGLTASVSAVTYRRYRPTEREKSVSPALRLLFFALAFLPTRGGAHQMPSIHRRSPPMRGYLATFMSLRGQNLA